MECWRVGVLAQQNWSDGELEYWSIEKRNILKSSRHYSTTPLLLFDASRNPYIVVA
jgi:hypothetical protein